jgi:hypothetical protein
MAHTNCSDEEARATLFNGLQGKCKDEKFAKDMLKLSEIGMPTQNLKRRRLSS